MRTSYLVVLVLTFMRASGIVAGDMFVLSQVSRMKRLGFWVLYFVVVCRSGRTLIRDAMTSKVQSRLSTRKGWNFGTRIFQIMLGQDAFCPGHNEC